jgi:phosphohistidine swiveling domain-containing protein
MRDKLQFIADMLEAKFKDMQEIEVTVERGVPYVLQTRTGKRTARAALKIITDLVKAGKISEEEALLRMKPSDIELLSTGEACPDPAKNLLIGEGTPVSPGVICGSVVFSSEYAEKYKKLGVKPILVKRNLDTSDIRCIKQSDGILIADGIGNNVSHAITVARSLNKAIVTGAPLRFDYENVRLNSRRLRSGDEITLDANTGRVYLGHTNIIEHKPGEELETLLGIADNLVSRGIIVSVSTPEDAKLVSKDHSIFFSPMGCLTPEQIGYLRGLIYGDKKDPDEIRKKLTHDYSAFIESAGNDRSLLVLGVIPEQNLRAVVPSRIRLESRLEFQRDYYEKLRLRDSLVLVGTKGIELKDGKIIGVNNGDELIYDGRKVRVNKICAGCGIELMFEDGGRTCVKIRDLSQIKGIDPNSQIESYVSPESLAAKDVLTSLEEEHLRLEKANPHLVYTLQLEAATDAVKNHPGSPVIIGKASPYQRTTEVDGEIYDLIPIRDLNRRRLERAQEVLNNGG